MNILIQKIKYRAVYAVDECYAVDINTREVVHRVKVTTKRTPQDKARRLIDNWVTYKNTTEYTRAVVSSKQCPECHGGLRRNLSLTGWWQCEQFGNEQFRRYPNRPPCHWQGFTE